MPLINFSSQENSFQSNRSNLKSKSQQQSRRKTQDNVFLNRSLHEIDPHRIVFYKKGLFQRENHYICELAYNDKHYFFSLQCVGDLHRMDLKNKSCVLVLPICP